MKVRVKFPISFLYDNIKCNYMNINQVPKYVNAIANMARWSQTTFIRTFYKFKNILDQNFFYNLNEKFLVKRYNC